MDLDRLYEWQQVAVGVGGLALTLAVAAPGEHRVVVGPVGFDPFYPVAACFVLVLGWSALALWRERSER